MEDSGSGGGSGDRSQQLQSVLVNQKMLSTEPLIDFPPCRYQKLWCDFRQYMVQEYVYATVEGKAIKNKIEEADTTFSLTVKSQVERADSFGSAKSARHE